jgi:hypothetical protein
MRPDVQAVNRFDAVALLTTGDLVPITNWFLGDGDGWPCGPDEADQAVAGPCPVTGKWYRIYLDGFTDRLS